MKTISAKELKEKLSDNDHDEILVDVREPFEHEGSHIPESENIPLDEVDEAVDKLKNIGTVYVHCASGNRSARACELLFERGVNVVNIDGGIQAWKDAGLQVIGGRKTLPMMRQVMIAAGSLILIGAALGAFVNPWWYLLSAFVGGGLFMAGVTGFCGMTYVLRVMPWNKKHSA